MHSMTLMESLLNVPNLETLVGCRDRAWLSLLADGLTLEGITALQVDDLIHGPEGPSLQLRGGQTVILHPRTASALARWIDVGHLVPGGRMMVPITIGDVVHRDSHLSVHGLRQRLREYAGRAVLRALGADEEVG